MSFSVSNKPPKEWLLDELRAHALVIGEVTLSSGQKASYYVDAKRALLRPAGFRACGMEVTIAAAELGADAVGGMSIGADPVTCAALAYPDVRELAGFFVRKERKEHGLQRWIEGPELEPGTRCLIVEDVVTTGGSTVKAIEAAGGAPFRALVTIDELYPERPDR